MKHPIEVNPSNTALIDSLNPEEFMVVPGDAREMADNIKRALAQETRNKILGIGGVGVFLNELRRH